MQRTLTRAIAIAFLATAATTSAQAADFYGNFDIGIKASKVNGISTTRIENGNSSESIFGVRGSEDLGGGAKAIFQLEGSFEGDDGTTNAPTFDRDTFVGLTSGEHTVKLGRLKTLNRAAVLDYDAFNASSWGIAMSAIDQNGSFAANAIQYDYAANGIKASIQHIAGEESGGPSTASTDAVQVRYANGPLTATVTHTHVDDAAPTAASTTNTMVGVGYNFGFVQTTIMYQDAKATAALPIEKRMVASATASVNDSVKIMAQAGHVKQINGDKANLVAIGGQYSLSKRTSLYASLSKSDLAGMDSKQFVTGVRHQF